MLYVSGRRSDTWPKRKQATDNDFRLEHLTILKQYEGKRYQDLPVRQQNEIKKFDVRCAIIPASWSMSDYIDFFKRLQGGGTPMTDHELRRALSQGPFTDLLDTLSKDEIVQRALAGCVGLKRDDTQQLLLRYFQFKLDPFRFGKPSLPQNGLQTMKHFNREMKAWKGDEFYKSDDLVGPLKRSLNLILHIFHENEAFRRPVSLVEKGTIVENDDLGKVWINSRKLRAPIWDCTVAAFAREDILQKEKAIRGNAPAIRIGLLDLMQTHPAFTDSLRSSAISTRVHLFATEILSIVGDLDLVEPSRVTFQMRKDLIKSAKKDCKPCSLCGQPLSPYEEHLHIDHIHPRSKGGTNDLHNLQVVHKTCNLRKSDKIIS